MIELRILKSYDIITGFVGLVASLRVNFRALSLFKDSTKPQYGSPFKRISVKERQLGKEN